MFNLNVKQEYLKQQERRERNNDKIEKESSGWLIGRSREYPAALFSHKSKTFKMNKRKGL